MQDCFGTWSPGSFPAAEPGVQEPSLVWVSITLPLELPPLLRSSLLCLSNCITSSFLPWIQLWVLVEKILSFLCSYTKKISHLKHPACLQEPCSLCWHPVLPRSTERKDKPNTHKITPNSVIRCWIQLREGKKGNADITIPPDSAAQQSPTAELGKGILLLTPIVTQPSNGFYIHLHCMDFGCFIAREIVFIPSAETQNNSR